MKISDLYDFGEVQNTLEHGARKIVKNMADKCFNEELNEEFMLMLSIAQRRAFQIGYKSALNLNLSDAMK